MDLRIAGLSLIAAAGLAATAHATSLQLAPSSRLWLEGDSTLHPYSSTATALKLDAQFEPGTPDPIINGKASAFELSVPVEGLRSGEKLMDRNIRKALKADEHPDIRFHMSTHELLPAGKAGSAGVKATGTLSIAGKENPIELQVEAQAVPEGVRVRGSKELLMTDFGIKPPTAMLGALKTKDKVVVHFDVVLQAGAPSNRK